MQSERVNNSNGRWGVQNLYGDFFPALFNYRYTTVIAFRIRKSAVRFGELDPLLILRAYLVVEGLWYVVHT